MHIQFSPVYFQELLGLFFGSQCLLRVSDLAIKLSLAITIPENSRNQSIELSTLYSKGGTSHVQTDLVAQQLQFSLLTCGTTFYDGIKATLLVPFHPTVML